MEIRGEIWSEADRSIGTEAPWSFYAFGFLEFLATKFQINKPNAGYHAN